MRRKYSVGVDIGGTHTNVAILDREGKILGKKTILTKDYPQETDFVNALAGVIRDVCQGIEDVDNIVGVGIGAPCVNAKLRAIDGATDLPWRGTIPIVAMLENIMHLPVVIENDANSAAIGEMIYGAARGMSDFIMITLGTGVGSGIVCDGRLLTGKSGFAGELGHMRFGFTGHRSCGCGREGCLQTICSSKGIVATALELMENEDMDSELRSLPSDRLTSKAIGEAFQRGDRLAREVFRLTEECLGKAFAEFASITDPEAIILFGGVANPEELDAAHITEVMESRMLHLYRGGVKVLFSALSGADAALKGAASLPWYCSENETVSGKAN